MDGWQAIATFALAAVPGILVLEILQFQRPRLRERSGLRGIAFYLIISAVVWTVAVTVLGADGHLASVIDSADHDGSTQVTAYVALAWRLAAAAIGVGLVCRTTIARTSRLAFRLEQRRRNRASSLGRFGNLLIELVAIPYAWDALLVGLRRSARAQLVHVRLQDGSDVYGILASGGGADFQGDGRGLVLDVEYVEQGGNLDEVPGSNGIFIVPEAVATISFLDSGLVDDSARVDS